MAIDIDGISEVLVDGKTGLLVSPDHDRLAEAIIGLLLNDKAEQMGVAVRKKVEQEFSVEKMVSGTEKVYL